MIGVIIYFLPSKVDEISVLSVCYKYDDNNQYRFWENTSLSGTLFLANKYYFNRCFSCHIFFFSVLAFLLRPSSTHRHDDIFFVRVNLDAIQSMTKPKIFSHISLEHLGSY